MSKRRTVHIDLDITVSDEAPGDGDDELADAVLDVLCDAALPDWWLSVDGADVISS